MKRLNSKNIRMKLLSQEVKPHEKKPEVVKPQERKHEVMKPHEKKREVVIKPARKKMNN